MKKPSRIHRKKPAVPDADTSKSDPVSPGAILGLAVVGCGEWGPNHIRNFSRTEGAKVVAAVDQNPAQLRRVERQYPGVQCYNDYRKLLADGRIGAFVIATPASTHYTIARGALLAGKHVLCEKPLCQTSPEAAKLVRLARQQKLVLMVGHVFLFNPGIVKLKELISKIKSGQLYYMAAVRTNLGPIRKDCNAAFDLATHDVSIFNWIMDSHPAEVSATGASFLQSGIEDVVSISLKYPGNVLATIHASWLSPKKIRQITVVGSQQMIVWDDLQLGAPITCYDKHAKLTRTYNDYGEFLRISTWEGDIHMPKVGTDEPLQVQTRAFVEAVTNGIPTVSAGHFGVGVVKVLEAIEASIKNNGRPVRIHS